ncbi:MAG TPA: hypothetical protein DCZ23_08000 [Lachnospiraceae bacterium]|nr:hypothetical protein [Lachnospiraceae bacterium]
MLYKYFKFDKKRIAFFTVIIVFICVLQYVVTGSIISKQTVTTEAGNVNSSVIGIIDNEEVIRQKFCFERKVVLSQFILSFAPFERKNTGDTVTIQMTDADNDIVYETDIDVDDITPGQTYAVNMEHTVTIPEGVVCCIRITCRSQNSPYAVIPTLNTTNRTDPNTYMSTLKMQTRKKSLNISYTYSYRQIYPLIILVLEFALIFVICFEHVTDYAVIYRKKRLKQLKRMEKEKNSTKHSRKKPFSIRNFVIYCLAEPKVEKNIRVMITVLNPVVLFIILETMNDTISGMYPNIWIFTWILLLSVQLVLFAVFGNMGIAMAVMDAVLFPAGLGNLFILNVRGTPLLPSDIFGLATATEVASTYSLKFTPAEFIMIPAFIIWIMLIFRFKKKTAKTGLYKKVIRRCTPVIASFLILFVLYSTDLLETCGIKDSVWNKVASCKTNGFYMNFFINLRYLKVSEPAGYSHDKIEEILNTLDTDSPAESTAPAQTMMPADDNGSSKEMLYNSDFKTCTALNGKKPNIILIMNESLADFSLVGNVNYNRDPLAYIHSMKENTIKGLDYVSVFGAGTSNSEFEAMTGNTMSFFPSGCNVYQQFMHESTFSLPSYLKSLGYACNAIHPSSGTNWNRTNTYKSMKFDSFITIEDFKNPEYVRYISDKESYKKVIELYENRDKSSPIFMFDMTIQNHGGYQTNTNWDEPVYVKDSYYDEAKEFLSASKVSDDAFKYLIEYFEKEEEPVLIFMFGDHWPQVETGFYEELLGKPQSEWNLDDFQKRYATPFILWANYDIEEGDNVVIGNNLVENLVLKQAGIELPLYNKYVEKVSETIPAMNVNGFMDKSGLWHKYGSDETEEQAGLINNYKILQYGYYSDTDKEKMSELFDMKN